MSELPYPGYWLAMNNDENATLCDKNFSLVCPHCGATTGATVISTPRLAQVHRYKPKRVIVGLRCQACGDAIALRYAYTVQNGGRLYLSEAHQELERRMESFEYQYLPQNVADDLREALTCFSHNCYNAAAAMCRRTIQSIAEDLGATGTTKVMAQVLEAKEEGQLDDESFEAIKQMVLDGHDGAHPHLPTVSAARASILVSIMKDVLYQLYVRKALLKRGAELRQEAIDAKKI